MTHTGKRCIGHTHSLCHRVRHKRTAQPTDLAVNVDGLKTKLRKVTGRMANPDLHYTNSSYGGSGDDLLDLLFDEQGSPLLDEMDGSLSTMPSSEMTLSDLNDFDADNFLQILSDQMIAAPDVPQNCDKICNSDHRYSRLPLGSSSSASCEEAASPPSSVTCTDSPEYSGGDSLSPWGSGVDTSPASARESTDTLDLVTFDSSLLQDSGFLNGLATAGVDNFSLDLDDQLLNTDDVKSLRSSGDPYLPMTVQDLKTDLHSSLNYAELRLSDEEKALLIQEGIILPTNMPLTKDEEHALKAVRRKIRNKVSAKESRKRKQTYVDGLEKRVKICTAHNLQLQKKVNSLAKENLSLLSQLKKVHSLITSTSNRPAQAGTCIMVMLLSFTFLILPSINPLLSGRQAALKDPGGKRVPIAGRSRNLLHDVGETPLDVAMETSTVAMDTTAVPEYSRYSAMHSKKRDNKTADDKLPQSVADLERRTKTIEMSDGAKNMDIVNLAAMMDKRKEVDLLVSTEEKMHNPDVDASVDDSHVEMDDTDQVELDEMHVTKHAMRETVDSQEEPGEMDIEEGMQIEEPANEDSLENIAPTPLDEDVDDDDGELPDTRDKGDL